MLHLRTLIFKKKGLRYKKRNIFYFKLCKNIVKKEYIIHFIAILPEAYNVRTSNAMV